MDPTASPLESGFSQQDTPCLLIEDSQPESQAPDDAEVAAAAAGGARFPLLSRHLPHLLPPHKDDPESVRVPSSFANGGSDFFG